EARARVGRQCVRARERAGMGQGLWRNRRRERRRQIRKMVTDGQAIEQAGHTDPLGPIWRLWQPRVVRPCCAAWPLSWLAKDKKWRRSNKSGTRQFLQSPKATLLPPDPTTHA